MMSDQRPAPALTPPKSHKDSSWEVKITRAKAAREAAQQLRKDQPATFPTRRLGRG